MTKNKILQFSRFPKMFWGILGLTVLVRFFLLVSLHDSLSLYSGAVILSQEMAHHIAEGNGMVFNREFHTNRADQIFQNGYLIDLDDFQRPTAEEFEPVYHYNPGYPYLLAGSFLLTGQETTIYLQIFTAILDICGLFLIFLLGRRFFSEPVTLVACLIYALWIPWARLSLVAYHDAFAPFLTLLSSYFFLTAVTDRKWQRYLYAGILLGCLGYFRLNMMFLPFFWGMGGALYQRNWRPLVWGVAAYGLMQMTLIPMGIQNKVRFGEYRLANSSKWLGMWEGLGDYENPFGAVADDRVALAEFRAAYPNLTGRPEEFNEYFQNRFWDAVKQDPKAVMEIFGKRFLTIFISPNNWGFPIQNEAEYDQYIEAGGSTFGYLIDRPLQFIFRAAPKIWEFLFLIGAILGLVIFRDFRVSALLWVIPVYAILSHIPIHFESRFFLPAKFPWVYFNAVAMVWLYNRCRGITMSLKA